MRFPIAIASLLAAAALIPVAFAQLPGSPIVASLVQVDAGTGIVLYITGSGFTRDSFIRWNNIRLNTTFIDDTSVTATVTSDLTAISGLYTISVSSPTGAVSQGLPAYIQPVLNSILPTALEAGGSGATIQVTGVGFNPLDQVVLTSLPYASLYSTVTTYINSTTLSAAIPASDLTGSIYASVTVQQTGCCFSRPLLLKIGNPPTLTSISPTTAILGNTAIPLIIGGSNFSGSLVYWNGVPQTTTVVSSTQLTATVSTAGLGLGSIPIWVVNADGGRSNALTLDLNPPMPSISSLTPASAAVGGPYFTLTVSGTGFLPYSSHVLWNNQPLATTYLSPTQLSALVPASDIASSGTANIAVWNQSGSTTSETSSSVAFLILGAKPRITSVNPNTTSAGAPAFPLYVAGSGFPSDAVVLWNTTALQTYWTSGSELSAVVPASLVTSPGAVAISVTGSTGVSNPVSFTVTPALPVTATPWIVNWASGLPAIAPGALISIYGSNLASSEALAPSVPLPLFLNQTSVIINGRRAPLYYVGPAQINAQVPFETELGNAVLAVQNNGINSANVTIAVTAIAPGVVTLGTGNHSLLWNDVDNTLNSSSNPALPGAYVTTYLTGQGALDQIVPTGAAAPLHPLANAKAPVTATVGGTPVNVTFAGLAPGTVGILQLNFQVPEVLAGEQLLTINIGGIDANVTVISVGTNPAPAAQPQ